MKRLFPVFLFAAVFLLAPQAPATESAFDIEVMATTMTQIVLQWDNPPAGTASFVLQRATNESFSQNLTTYTLSNTTRIYSDTNRPTVSKTRFTGLPGAPLLDRNTTYYYRLRADLSGGAQRYTNTVSARVSEPLRGAEGDLWADIVLGKPDFGQNVVGHPTKHGTFFGGGIVIDRTVRPNRMYIADCNNNRVLGIRYLGVQELGGVPGQNLALNRPYLKSENPVTTYNDELNKEFTDGVPSTTWPNSFGYTTPADGTTTVTIDVDLGSAKEINFVTYSTGGGTQNYRAGSLTVFVSTDGTTWTEAASAANTAREAEMHLLFGTISARYVRFRGTSQQHVGGSADWFFIGEGGVFRIADEAIAQVGTPCSTDSDCSPGNVCRLTPERGADIVIGQPDFGSSAGDGDSSAQLLPYRQAASASTLCLTLQTQISIGETVTTVNMALDSEGSLYVPDVFNNRILKYVSPFETDTVADEVWGQADFAGNEPNKGMSNPSSSSLRFLDAHSGGVAFDNAGNMWVADTGNHRVLRFPKNQETGVIAKTADLVLGQQNFSSRNPGGYNRTLAQLWMPRDVEFDSSGRLYVGDGDTAVFDGRIVVFEPPFSSGMAAARRMPIPMDMELNPSYAASTLVLGFSKDVMPNRLWVQKNSWTTELFDLESGESVTSVLYPTMTACDVDSDGNLFIVAKWYGTFRYLYTTWAIPWSERQAHGQVAFPEGNAVTADTTGGIIGITTFGSQLIISERSRMLIWNDYKMDQLVNGAPADDLFGEPDFTTIRYQAYCASLQVDAQRRLWVSTQGGGLHTLQAFNYPLTHGSTPVKQVMLADGAPDALAVRGGGATAVAHADFTDFAVVGTGDKIWIADTNMSRVLRINNVDGLEDLATGPYVDVVLGQETLTAGEANQGGSIGPQTLAVPYNVGLSPEGDLYISDNGGEVGSNRRILIYRKERFPDNPPSVLFNSAIGDPDAVIGTGNSLTVNGLNSADPICSPFELGFHPQGTIAVPMNGYSDQRFPLVYLDPATSTLPDFALGDCTSYPSTCFVDADGNVFIGDFDWSRVLIYKKPFKNVREYFSLLGINRVPVTQNILFTWRSRIARSYKVFWSHDEPSPGAMWLPASGSLAEQSGTGGILQFIDDGLTTAGYLSAAPLGSATTKRMYRVRETR